MSLAARILLLCQLAFLVPGTCAQQKDSPSSAQLEILDLLNKARAEHQLAPLVLDLNLSAAAQKHSEQMAERKSISHQLPGEPPLVTRLADAGAHLDAAAENVADTDSPQDAHEEWMLSSGHRANILDSHYNSVGIGIAQAAEQRFFFTEDFAHRVPVYSPERLEDKIFEELNRLRSQHRLAALGRARISMLEHEACRADVNPKSIGNALSAAGWVVVFSSADPDYLPPDMPKIAAQSEAQGVALGACYPPSASFANFRVVAVFFRKNSF